MNAVLEGHMVYCRGCGKQIHSTASVCPHCGAPQSVPGVSDKKILPAFLLCFFVGFLGVHRFYNDLLHPWVVGYVRHPVMRGWWKYIDIDEQAAAKGRP